MSKTQAKMTDESLREKVKEMQQLFKAYPEIFPSGYFRFLGGGLKKEISRNTAWSNNSVGFYFSWWRGQRNPKRWKIEKICVRNRKRGMGTKLMTMFFKKLDKEGWSEVSLKVLKTNEVAIKFYKKYNFQIVADKGDYWLMKKTKKVNKEAIVFRRIARIAKC